MKTNQLFIIFALLSFVYLLPIGREQSALAAEKLFPRISFEKTVFDLGDVGQSAKGGCEFKFTNIGSADGGLKIGKISRTCGCTVFQLDKKEYASGETERIRCFVFVVSF